MPELLKAYNSTWVEWHTRHERSGGFDSWLNTKWKEVNDQNNKLLEDYFMRLVKSGLASMIACEPESETSIVKPTSGEIADYGNPGIE